ncbi:YecA/YgfB family protein [Mangrovitalea sediminis]|uniref:YecA/YgfB family protein n=1 Tax=Mangrovitalea sediminis TaxID=1982043 RepID=UPI000BE5D93E|nr:YecA family protein [Mangrovitalea sediminis]
MLSEQDILALEEILFAEEWADEALDFFGLHGVVAASVVGPTALTDIEVFALSTGQEIDTVDKVPAHFAQAIENLGETLRKAFDLGAPVELPEPEDGDPHNALENWCAGFIDAFLLHEDDWLDQNEEEVADLLVPIMSLSGLFEDEDFERVRQNNDLFQRMSDAIPDTLTDLYLLFHAPE